MNCISDIQSAIWGSFRPRIFIVGSLLYCNPSVKLTDDDDNIYIKLKRPFCMASNEMQLLTDSHD